jgi:hypothetical protein
VIDFFATSSKGCGMGRTFHLDYDGVHKYVGRFDAALPRVIGPPSGSVFAMGAIRFKLEGRSTL